MQQKVLSWTNPATAVLRNLDFGFQVSDITTIDTTNGGSWYWASSMASGSYLDVDAGTITASNGFIPLAQGAIFGAAISGFTLANPGVITASNIALLGIVAGDTIKVSAVADNEAGTTSLNGTYVVASVTATTITLTTSTVGKDAWVSGGFVTRVSDSSGNAVANKNVAINGVSAGTGVVGANNAVMVAIGRSDNPVN